MKTRFQKFVSDKKYKHDLSHDVTTTSGFGFCQPLGVDELTPDATISQAHNIFVRAQPLVKPTYGRLKGHTYSVFVKTSDLYHPWPQLLESNTFSGMTSYIPSFVPSIPLNILHLMVCCFGECAVVATKKSSTSTVVYTPSESSILHVSPSSIQAGNMDLESLFTKLCDTYIGPSYNFGEFLYRFAYSDYKPGLSSAIVFSSDFNTLEFNVTRRNAAGATLETDLTPLNADYVFQVPSPTSGPYADHFIYACFRLSTRGRNIRKVLLGCGYQLCQSSRSVSLLPVMAYYKAWFDLFAPQRFVTWASTPLFRLLEVIENYNLDLTSASVWSEPSSSSPAYLLRNQLANFVLSLGECYFTSAPDYVSSHITGASVSPAQNFLRTVGPTGEEDIEVVSGINHQAVVDADSQGVPRSLNALSRAQLRAINFLAKYVNIRTAAGGRIDKFLKSIYGSGYQCIESNYVNFDSFSIDISDVMSYSETEKAYLGEFAGKGLGLNRGSRLKYSPHNKEHGFLVTLFTIVPDSKYSQGVDPRLFHIKKFDFYTPGFDGVTLVPSSKLALYGTYDVLLPSMKDWMSTGSFGNIPVYSEYKQHQSILNGDCSLRSTRKSYLPFTLDKLLPYKDFSAANYVDYSGTPKTSYAFRPDVGLTPSLITNGTLWRYVGRYAWLGQYDRVFYNSGTVSDSTSYAGSHDPLDDVRNNLEDNFIVHCYVDSFEVSGKLPLGDSFDTGSDSESDTITVEHQ